MSSSSAVCATPWRKLPDDLRREVLLHLGDDDKARLACTAPAFNRLVETQTHVRAWLGDLPGRLPNHCHARLGRLTAPYGGLVPARPLLEAVRHAVPLPPDEGQLFAASLEDWAVQEHASGTPLAAIQGVTASLTAARSEAQPRLAFHDLPIATLPGALCALPELAELAISKCPHLRCLPPGLGMLKKLATLRVNGCARLQELPASLGGLRALAELRISFCDSLISLPPSLGKLHGLRLLALYSLPNLVSLPEHLGELMQLEELSLGSCRGLRRLPASTLKLSALRQLSLCNCSSLEALPSPMRALVALRWLHLNGCNARPASQPPVACRVIGQGQGGGNAAAG